MNSLSIVEKRKYMSLLRFFSSILVIALTSLPLSVIAVDYNYLGQPYTSATPPFTLGDQIIGSFTLANPIEPFSYDLNLNGQLTDFSFDDGDRVWTLANSSICNFEVSTNGSGRIERWLISLREFPTPAPGNPQRILELSNFIGGTTDEYTASGSAGNFDCDTISMFPTIARANAVGTWSSDAELPPEMTTYNYTGEPFSMVESPYVSGGVILGTLVTDRHLPPNTVLNYNGSVTLNSILPPGVLELSFSDGLQAWAIDTSRLCNLQLTTDSQGEITDWTISFWEDLERLPMFPNIGDPVNLIETNSSSDRAGITPYSSLGICDASSPIALSPFGQSNAQGNWTRVRPQPIAQPSTSIPSLNIGGIAILALLLAGLAGSRFRLIS